MRNTEYCHRGFESRDLAIIRMELHTMNSYKRKQTSKCVQCKIDLVSKTPVKPLLSLLSRPYSEDVIGLLKSLAKLFSQPVYLWSRYKISFFILEQCSLFTKKNLPTEHMWQCLVMELSPHAWATPLQGCPSFSQYTDLWKILIKISERH